MKKQKIEIDLDSSIYSKDAIVKCLYWYSNDYKVDIKSEKTIFKIKVESYEESSEEKIKLLKKKLKRDLMDFNLRDTVKKETTPIRELIIAKAFSHGEFDEEPKGNLMDPLGIKFLSNEEGDN